MTRTATLASLAFGALVLGAGGMLWAEYGAAVFFDALAAGLVGCFY